MERGVSTARLEAARRVDGAFNLGRRAYTSGEL